MYLGSLRVHFVDRQQGENHDKQGAPLRRKSPGPRLSEVSLFCRGLRISIAHRFGGSDVWASQHLELRRCAMIGTVLGRLTWCPLVPADRSSSQIDDKTEPARPSPGDMSQHDDGLDARQVVGGGVETFVLTRG